MAWDIGADQQGPGSLSTLIVQNAAFTHAASTPTLATSVATLTIDNAYFVVAADPLTLVAGSWSVDFSGISQEVLYKFEVWFGGVWVDLDDIGGTKYLKAISMKLGGAGMSADPIAGTWSATVANDNGIFHPNHPTSAYKTLFQVGRKVRISVGRMHGGFPYYWQRMIGYMDAPKFSHGSRTVEISGCDYTKNLTDTILKHPGNYFGTVFITSSISSSGATGAELYTTNDAFGVTGSEANSIDAGWVDSNTTISSAADVGGGSVYVAKILRGATAGAAYNHNANIGTVTVGTTYQITFKAKYAVGNAYGLVQLYQTVDGVLRSIGAKHTLSGSDYTETKYVFTARKTGALECRFSFADTAQSAENDELRIDGLTVKKHEAAWNTYPLPVTSNGPYFVTLDGIPRFSGADTDTGQATVPVTWHYDEDNRFFYFDETSPVDDGTANLYIYYYTDQAPEGVIASLLKTAGLYATDALALAAMDYTATGITLRRVWFDAGTTALVAVRLVCERCNYRFWFSAEGVPCFKPAPTVGEIAFDFEKFGDLRDLSDFQDLNEIKNSVTIEGAEQDIFNVSRERVSSKCKGAASDATSIAAYLEKTESITNQLFETDDDCAAMAATRLAASKDPKLYAELQLFANVVPLEVGDTVRWRVEL